MLINGNESTKKDMFSEKKKKKDNALKFHDFTKLKFHFQVILRMSSNNIFNFINVLM